jgi:hypothetical protein
VFVTARSKADTRCAAGDDRGIAIQRCQLCVLPASSSLRNDCGAMLQFPAGRRLRCGAVAPRLPDQGGAFTTRGAGWENQRLAIRQMIAWTLTAKCHRFPPFCGQCARRRHASGIRGTTEDGV